MSKILILRDGDVLAAMRPHLPPDMANVLEQVVAEQVEAEQIRQLGRKLASLGLVSAAAAAFRCSTIGEHLPDEAFADLAALERALGMNFVADAHDRVARRLLGNANSPASFAELDDGVFAVQCAFVDPQGYGAMLAGLPEPVLHNDPLRDPYFTKFHFMKSYCRNLRGTVEDYSFFVVDAEGKPVLLVECDVLGWRHLGCREVGIELTVLCPDADDLDAAKNLAVRQLSLISNWAGCSPFWLEFARDEPLPAEVGQRLTAPGGSHVTSFRLGWINLDQDIAGIESGYRPSTRQRIRWGRENVRVVTHRDGVDIPAIYGELCRKINRACSFPLDVLADLLRQERLSGFVAYYQDVPSCIVLTSHHGSTTYDMATAKLPLGKLPLSHVLVHRAIMDAKEQGQRRFDFGPLWDRGGDAKQMGIAEFKCGFASSYQERLLIKLAA